MNCNLAQVIYGVTPDPYPLKAHTVWRGHMMHFGQVSVYQHTNWHQLGLSLALCRCELLNMA